MKWPGMYRLMSSMLIIIVLAAAGLSAVGLVGFSPLGILVTAALGVAATFSTTVLGALWRGASAHLESSVVTGLLIALIVPPTLDARDLIGVSAAGAIAGASKWLIAPRGRHLFNPAATGVFVASVFGLTVGLWWVATPWLTPLIIAGGALVAFRSGYFYTVGWFLALSMSVLAIRLLVSGEPLDSTVWLVITSYPLVFLGLFMVSEPLTQATRRFDQFLVAGAIAIPAALPFSLPLGFTTISSSPELALLWGNAVAWALTALRAVHRAEGVTLHEVVTINDTVREYRFASDRPFQVEPGQWVELHLPHRGVDSRGSRRVMSVSRLSPPAQSDQWSFSVTTRHSDPGSSWKRSLSQATPGTRARVGQVGGDFLPPHALVGHFVMVARGVGITPFAALLFNARDRDLGMEGTLIVVSSRDEEELYPELSHVRGVRRVVVGSADQIHTVLPDAVDGISWAGVSGSPGFVTAARKNLENAGVKRVHTDRFIGY